MTSLSLQDAARKKQLGQYFTGKRVGRLLAALAEAESANTIIDPMVGAADLLVSCLEVGAMPDKLVGLELDPLALARAHAALRSAVGVELTLTDAFSAMLPAEQQFDLVITNPPYIRYQSKGEVDGLSVPSAEAVRAGLLRAIKARTGLADDARSLILRAARRYPGTADIAVPAWILSASLVREGGMLAVVAPQAWLSRNYAHAVRELLDEAFDVEVIVEDGDASWFAEAQVRTHLVVARRRAVGPSLRRSVLVARATSDLTTEGFLRGALGSEQAVAAALRKVTSTRSIEVTTGLTAHVEHDLVVAARGQVGHVPARIAAALDVAAEDISTRTLESYGWRAGQGLRTGANDFFYIDYGGGAARPAHRWGRTSLAIPQQCLLPAVRRQSELGEELEIDTEHSLPSRVVNFRGWVTAVDKRRMVVADHVRVLPEDVAAWITEVAAAPLSENDPTKLFPNLAAVAPNSKTDRSGRPVAFWYQLPELAPRHKPSLFVGRVCGGQPTAYANVAGAVIDANFSTLWPVDSDALPAEALMALLHSGWAWANLEATCTVLGGGALKVEATDLRRLALPDLAGDNISRLGTLGRALLKRRNRDVTRAIDEVVTAILAPSASATSEAMGLRAFAANAMGHRSRR